MSLHRLLGLVLAAAIGLIPLAPPEHVHEGHDADHHPAAVVHRHTTPHSGVHHAAAPGSVVDDDDAPVLTLEAVFTAPAGVTVLPAPAVRPVILLEPTAPRALHPTPGYVELLIHGPPRAPAGLRAPPESRLL